MWGAIIGDIVGSRHEFDEVKTKTFELFHSDCYYTDDSVCTAAVAQILLTGAPADATLQRWCRFHPGRGYGGMFSEWIDSDYPQPYDSYGNGAAMRVSPAAYLQRGSTLEDALNASDEVTEVTHDHPEGMKGARATTHAIWLALQGSGADVIRQAIESTYDYDLTSSVDEIRPDYFFDETCQGTVPQAIVCALESTDYEDAIRNAISIGGDADTLAAIAGPIAEALHGIPDEFIVTAVDGYLTSAPDIVRVMKRMYGEER